MSASSPFRGDDGRLPQSKSKTRNMKKIAFFCCALLALGFASCDDKSDLGTIQTNPQLPAVAASEVQPEVSSELKANALNLNGATEIPAITCEAPENLPAGAELTFEMELASKADFSNAITLPVENGKVSATAWNEYYRETLGNNNTPLPNYIRFAAYFIQGTQRVRVGSLDTWYGSKQLAVTPVTFNYATMTCKADQGDMLLADFNGDGTYQGLVVINGEYTFSYDGKTYGKKSATVVEEGTTPCTVTTAGVYIVEFTPATLGYKATIVRSLGAIGDFNKWAKQTNLTQNGTKFTGVVDFGETLEGDNTFKFRMSNNNNLTLGGFQYDIFFGGANMDVPGEGEYEITVDFSTIPYVYTATKK